MYPQYPDSDNEPNEAAALASVPTQLNFAQEVRSDRLSILWKVTLFIALLLVWAMVVVTGANEEMLDHIVTDVLFPTGLLIVGCALTGYFLKRERFGLAVTSYTAGAFGALAVLTLWGSTFGRDYFPFVFPLLVFVVGLLVPARQTLILLLAVIALLLGGPLLADGQWELSSARFFALVLTIAATGLSAQVSGELFGIAEWALDNYRRERRTSYALFDSREALQKSFLRQTALTDQLQQVNNELETARKAEEEAKNFRGQFLANMSHELRTPLNAIIGFSQTMLDFPAMYDGVELPIQYRQDMGQVLSSGKHLLTIINDILDLSKVDAGKLDLDIQPVDIGPIVKGVLSTAVGLVGDKGDQIHIQRDFPEELPMVLGDPLRLRQVLLNLYSNAAKFTDSGYIKLQVYRQDGEVIFAVEDTGIGIADSEKAFIFEEFRQGTSGRKKGRQGAGLGLAISQQLLRLMNGRIWFDSTLGRGSTFYLALPEYVPGEEEPVTLPTKPATKRLRVPHP
ncbi:MAG: HAMP domain-containing histidine kinase [Chloroflexi bacterium]|nr:HAMP domain-containing histidine kinase [Chloroflexota bacterium]